MNTALHTASDTDYWNPKRTKRTTPTQNDPNANATHPKDTLVNITIPNTFARSITEIEALRPDRIQIEPDNPRPSDDRRDPAVDDVIDEADDSLAARRQVARCADGNGTLSALFFSDNVNDIARAKAMCALCPLQAECLSGALEREEPWGVWGGELLSGGRIVANKRPCGRPPKNPRPEVVFDEMGPVESVA